MPVMLQCPVAVRVDRPWGNSTSINGIGTSKPILEQMVKIVRSGRLWGDKEPVYAMPVVVKSIKRRKQGLKR